MSTRAVDAVDVTFHYGERVAIQQSSFAIDAGTITALIGPNGSGKSTILSGIAGLLAPTDGSLDVHHIGNRRRRISYVLQTTKVNDALPITVREVVAMGRYAGKGAYGWLGRDDRIAIDEALERMDIGHLGERHLHELSGGQRQRVLVAQGLAQDHDVLLLDEPLTGLDLTSARAIDDVIHDEHARGCTVVMSTHDLAEARVADRVILLAGRVVASGPPEEVLTLQHLSEAYGPSLLHVDGERLFLDDPAHSPVAGRHIHRDRSISVDSTGITDGG